MKRLLPWVVALLLVLWLLATEARVEGLRQQVRVLTMVSIGMSRDEVEYRLGRPLAVRNVEWVDGSPGQMLHYRYRLLGMPTDSFDVVLSRDGRVVSVYVPWGAASSIPRPSSGTVPSAGG
jgi:hypothetical protein